MSHEFPERVKKIVVKRSLGLCEGCGIRTATEYHHRKFKSRGGSGVAGNCLHLCGFGNVGGCHARAHSGQPPQGWAVASWEDPLLIPVTRYDGVFFLTNDGRLTPADLIPEF